mmetsp:Transcript_13595/g.37566  ORF Transcript_13595/g.37566 Transcript_13595/m.37566 type:complete len:1008 (-) Transcript_13595:126-3149(-)
MAQSQVLTSRNDNSFANSPERNSASSPTDVTRIVSDEPSNQKDFNDTMWTSAPPLDGSEDSAGQGSSSLPQDNQTGPQQAQAQFSGLSSSPSENEQTNAVANGLFFSASTRSATSFLAGGEFDSLDEEDDDDEEEDDDDECSSMGYSDDSSFTSSLNDAYFRPQPGDNLARPWSGGRLVYSGTNGSTGSGGGSFNYPPIHNPYQIPALSSAFLNGGGGTSTSSYGSTSNISRDESRNSLIMTAGPIQEDAEATNLDPPVHIQNQQHPSNLMHSSVHSSLSSSGDLEGNQETAALLHYLHHHQHHLHNSKLNRPSPSKSTKRERRKTRKNHQRQQLQRLQLNKQQLLDQRQAEQAQAPFVPRETLPDLDDGTWRDPFWAGLFVLHLLLISWCALRFGFGVILFREPWGSISSSAAAGTLTNDGSNSTMNVDAGYNNSQDDNVRRLVDTLNNATTPVATNTTDTNDNVAIVAKNATLSDILFSTDDTFLMHKSNDDETIDEDGGGSGADDAKNVKSSDDFGGGSFTIDYKNVLAITFFAGFYACILSYISFGFMLILARSLILIMLIFSILVSLAWGIIGLTADPYGIISVMGFAALLSTLGYTMYTWSRIPFAATNLYTALTAMRCTADITILGLLSLVVAFGWCLLWSMAFIGIVNNFNHEECDTKDACHAHVSRNHIPLYLLFLLSFHWTTMVIKNVVRVTVASAISTWWFQPSAIGPFCTSAVVRPLARSLSTSLGSICFGSLIISPAQWLLSCGHIFCGCFCGESTNAGSKMDMCTDRAVCFGFQNEQATSGNDGDDGNGGGVVADTGTTVDSVADTVGLCRRLSGCLNPCHNWLRSCSRWAFTYIGMYGYPFHEAGKRALHLFEARGWMEVVDDPLILNVLLMASVVIGGSTGVFAVVVEETDGFEFTSFHQPIITAFVIGSVLGYVLSNILLLGVVGSAVNTIIVCFAAAPLDFDKNHPRMSREMREVWSQHVLWEQAPTPKAGSTNRENGAASSSGLPAII